MLFEYKVLDQSGNNREGSIDAVSEDVAISSLQRKGYIIVSIRSAEKKSFFSGGELAFLERVSNKEIVILSRQIATLFEAQVSALRVFRLLGSEASNPLVNKILTQVADDLQGGTSISKALAKHPKVFSSFYCNMVLAGEETGRLDQTFRYLADYLDRSYTVTSKAQHALVYPAFVIAAFIGVMVIMMVVVIPRLSGMITESGVELPIYTKVVIGLSTGFQTYGLLVFIALAALVVVAWKYSTTANGRKYFDQMKVELPVIGNLYRKLYLSRIADNMSTMLTSGIAMAQAIEITAAVVENVHYEEALLKARDDIKNGASVAKAFGEHEQIPPIMVQMIRVGEETGELGTILDTLAVFYQREVEQAVDTMVGLIEPMMIILLGGGVGTLIAAVLMPIYDITMSMQ
jgi:type II secretory pathway component PulF